MDSVASILAQSFDVSAVTPVMSLRGGSALDDYEIPPPFDPIVDEVTPAYLEAQYWGIHHLDSQSWLFYLPHLLAHALRNRSNSASGATGTFLFSLRPPDREPPRFGSLSDAQAKAVVAVLDTLAFADESAWRDEAIVALEEYWAPGARHR